MIKIQVKNLFRGAVSATALKGIIAKTEIGVIDVAVINDYFQINQFRVREAYRNQGIGKRLLKEMIKQAKANNICKMVVFPNSEPYEGENRIDTEKLYQIYIKMGFEFCDSGVDTSRPDHKMIMYL